MNITRTRLLIVPLLASLIWLHSCGFQPRGSNTIPVDAGSIYLATNLNNDVGREVRQQLELLGVTLNREASGSDYIVRISQERLERDVLSVSPRTGRVGEYELTLGVYLSVNRGSGETLLENELITTARDYLYDETAVVSGFDEEQLIRREMARQLADRILLRLQAVTTRDPATAAAH